MKECMAVVLAAGEGTRKASEYAGRTTNGEWAGAEYTDRTVFFCI